MVEAMQERASRLDRVKAPSATLAGRLLRGVLALVMVTLAAGCAPDAKVGTQKGEVAPDFSLPALEGGEQSLRDYRGRVVLLNFWATWCGPCRAEMPDMQAVYEELRDRGFVVVAVNGGEGRERVQSFVEEFGLTFPVLVDEEREVLRQYGVRGFPTTFVIDGDGVIQQVIVGGPLPGSAVRRLVEGLLK
jgi:peroxiredoxin